MPSEYLLERNVFDTLFGLVMTRGNVKTATTPSVASRDADLRPTLNNALMSWSKDVPYQTAAHCSAVYAAVEKELADLQLVINNIHKWKRVSGPTIKQTTSHVADRLNFDTWPGNAEQLAVNADKTSVPENAAFKIIEASNDKTATMHDIYSRPASEVKRLYDVPLVSLQQLASQSACPCMSVSQMNFCFVFETFLFSCIWFLKKNNFKKGNCISRLLW